MHERIVTDHILKHCFCHVYFTKCQRWLYLIIGWLLIRFPSCFAFKSFLCFVNPLKDSTHKFVLFSPWILENTFFYRVFFQLKKKKKIKESKVVPVQPNNLHATFQLGTALCGSVTQLGCSSCPAIRESTLPWRSRGYITVRSSQGRAANGCV